MIWDASSDHYPDHDEPVAAFLTARTVISPPPPPPPSLSLPPHDTRGARALPAAEKLLSEFVAELALTLGGIDLPTGT